MGQSSSSFLFSEPKSASKSIPTDKVIFRQLYTMFHAIKTEKSYAEFFKKLNHVMILRDKESMHRIMTTKFQVLYDGKYYATLLNCAINNLSSTNKYRIDIIEALYRKGARLSDDEAEAQEVELLTIIKDPSASIDNALRILKLIAPDRKYSDSRPFHFIY